MPDPILVAADVGNVTLEYRPPESDTWVIEPSLVRTQATGGYSFTSSRRPRTLTYVDGPAKVTPRPFLIGEDAAIFGAADLSIIGAASARVRSDAYLLLHLYAIIQSLPEDTTEAHVLFAGGLPARDSMQGEIERALKARLKGTHLVVWNDHAYTLTIDGSMFVPQPVAAVASMLFTSDGRVRSNGDLSRKRFLLDIGGGTTDWTGRIGLTLIPGAEGGADLGLATAAASALRIVQKECDAPSLTLAQVMDLFRADSKTAIIYVHGTPIDITEHITAGIAETSQAIMAVLPAVWYQQIQSGELALCGGGGAKMSKRIRHDFKSLTTVNLLPRPLTVVAEGIQRMARYKLNS